RSCRAGAVTPPGSDSLCFANRIAWHWHKRATPRSRPAATVPRKLECVRQPDDKRAASCQECASRAIVRPKL
ncbi:MAG: hypothetical protein PHO37_17805, partial [Kiritimatiellae bacterium]|nr:hypothetical protein [Kiritimatiellia bacterium]